MTKPLQMTLLSAHSNQNDRLSPSDARGRPLSLKELVTLDDLFLDLDVKREHLFDAAAAHWSDGDEALVGIFVDALEAREKSGSTGLGKGVAIPHARLSRLKTARVALIRTRQGIDFNAADGELVTLFFCLLVPLDSPQEHLELLSSIASLLAESSVREKLFECSGSTALQVISERE